MKTLRSLLIGSVAALCCSIAAHAEPPTGLWTVNANGYGGALLIGGVSNGNFSGLFLGNPIKGFWSESSQKLVFWRAIGANPDNIQIYTAYKFLANSGQPNGSHRLAGYFEAFAGTGASAIRSVFGWYAIPRQ
jgi:hypothetical protein